MRNLRKGVDGEPRREPPGLDYSAARFITAFCAARQTTCGVAGMVMFSWPTASVNALITAGGEAMAPASPHPFRPSGFVVQGVEVVSTLNEQKSAARGMR